MALPAAVPLIVAGASALAGALKNIFGRRDQKKAAEEAKRRARIQEAENQAFYDKNFNTPYVATEEAANTIAEAQRTMAEQNKLADQSAVASGASSEAQIANREAAGKNLARFFSQLGAQGTAYKNNIRRGYVSGQANANSLYNNALGIQSGLAAQDAESGNNLSGNALSLAMMLYGGGQPNAATGTNNLTAASKNISIEPEAGSAFKQYL